jgi:pimeloyl-ACP methyl ester carboxylesterase
VLGTSRGGLIAMYLAVAAPDRLRGICFNDIGPVIEPAGLARIKDYVGRNPAAKTHAEVAARMPAAMEGFANVPPARWLAEAQRLYEEKPDGLVNRYDPELRVAFLAAFDAPPVDLWPAFDACAGLPLALLRGENSDLLSAQTAEEMRRRRPDMIFAEAPDRGHIPFLDEAESLEAIHRWLGQMT